MKPARILTALLVFLVVVPARAAPDSGRAARAGTLYGRALERLRRDDVDSRRLAIDELERATLLAPGNPGYELTLARTYYQAGYLRNARERFERVTRMAPEESRSRYGLGQVWRRDWLKYLDETSLARAVENLSLAARLEPSFCDAWLLLVPLLVEQQRMSAAAAAAARAVEADPRRAEALIAEAYASYRLGRIAHAESAFAAAVPRLPKLLRQRFDDIAPVATARDTFVLHRLSPADQIEFTRRFWKEHDPDLSTSANEALLEYWSRVGHAMLLYFDAKRRAWDERGEVYVRYGPPQAAVYNPVGEKLYILSPFGMPFPANILVWHYPSLGMRVTLQDRLLSEYYQLPISLYQDPDPNPNPDSLARRGDVLATAGGRGVFPVLPPGARSLPLDGALARFEGAAGPRLLAQLAAPGAPGDSLAAEWVVLDSARVEVARGSRALAPSACDPAEEQVADFAADLSPGRYLVGLSVRDRSGGRGVRRSSVEIVRAEGGLRLSDVVISCGLPFMGTPEGGAPTVRLEPNPAARVAGREPLTAYFEIYHLTPGRDGRSRFEYVYTVRSARKDTRIWIQRAFQPRPQTPTLSATREEEHAGELRRQFVRVPVQSLPAGPYRLEVRIRDLIAGSEATGTAEFVRLGERETPRP